MAINDTGVLYGKFQSQFLNLYLLNLPSCYHTLFEQINASQMNDNYDNGTYFYKGEDDKRSQQNVQTIDYISNITSIKVYVMYGCDRILLVSYLDSIITIEFKAYCECDSIKHLHFSSSLKTIGQGFFDRWTSITRLELPSYKGQHLINHNGNSYQVQMVIVVNDLLGNVYIQILLNE